MENKFKKIIEKYIEQNPVRFHIPAHKGKKKLGNYNCFSYDITELDFSDNLNNPSGLIREEELRLSEIFNTKDTLISVNGATACMIAAILSVMKSKEKILLPSNSHVSAYYGAIHAGAYVVRCDVGDPISGLSLEELKNAVDKQSDIMACIITNPTYYGCVENIKEMLEYLKDNGITSIVDESHGTHLVFSEQYPPSALQYHADFVIHSGHKTVGGLTQTAFLHINHQLYDHRSVRRHLRSIQSTSPSYVLLLSAIEAIDELNSKADILKEIDVWYNELVCFFQSCDEFSLLNLNTSIERRELRYDPFKLCISTGKYDGKKIAQFLEEEYHIYCELSSDELILFVLGVNTTKEEIDRLMLAFQTINQNRNEDLFREKRPKRSNIDIARITDRNSIDIRTYFYSDYEEIYIEDADGRICADFITIYPPGIALYIPGEIISSNVMIDLINAEIKINGAGQEKIKVKKMV